MSDIAQAMHDLEMMVDSLAHAIEAATAKPDRWQVADAEGDSDPAKDAPNGFEPCGPWKPFGLSPGNEELSSYDYVYWRRPLKRVSGAPE